MTESITTPLNYAPPARSPLRPLIVLAAGVFTSIVTLYGVYVIRLRGDVEVMGWYANYILPVGALLVGMAAGSGYGLASYWTGVKIRLRGIAVLVLSLQAIAYFSAQYVEFRVRDPYGIVQAGTAGGVPIVDPQSGQKVTVAPLNFIQDFHQNAVHFAWKQEGSDRPGEPLGGWGYCFRLLEIFGFCAGGLVVPLIFINRPYCDLCQMYMKQRKLATIPASTPLQKIKRNNAEGAAAYARAIKEAADSGERQMAALVTAGESEDADSFVSLIAAAKPGTKAAGKLPQRIEISLTTCPNCYSGELKGHLVTGKGKKLRRTLIRVQPFVPAFIRSVVERDAAPHAQSR